MIFNFLERAETLASKKEASRSEVFSKIAEAKRNEKTFIHIDAKISMELNNELRLTGCSAYASPGFSGTNIYWEN